MEEQGRDSPKKFDRRKLLLAFGLAGAGAAAGLLIHKVPSLVDKIRGKKSIWRIGFEGQVYAIAPDLVVDGADDDVQIQQAVDALPFTGGKIILYGGNWVLGAKVSRAINNITFEGAGKNTYLAHDGVTNLIDAGAQTGWLIKDLRTDAGGLGGTFGTGATCLRQNVWINTTYFNDNPIALPKDGGTMTGGITLPEVGGILEDAALSADGKFSMADGEIGVGGAAIAFGKMVYFNSAGKWVVTDADAEATTKGRCGMCVVACGGDTQAITVMFLGKAREDDWNWATVGAPLFLDTTTAGGLTETAPSGSGDCVRIGGYVIDANTVDVRPSDDWLEIA